MVLYNQVETLYLNKARELNRLNPNFFSYADKLLAKHKYRLNRFVEVSKKRRANVDQMKMGVNLMAVYNFMHYSGNIHHYLPKYVNKKNTKLESIIFAGGAGTRLSLIGADMPKPLIGIPTDKYFKPLISYSFDALMESGCNRFVICANEYTKGIKDYLNNVQSDLKFIKKVVKNKKEAMMESIISIDNSSDIIIKTAADTFRKGNSITKALTHHLSYSNPEDKLTIIYRKVNPKKTGLSTNLFSTHDGYLGSISRLGSELICKENNETFYGIKLGIIFGKNLSQSLIKYSHQEMNNTYNQIIKNNPKSIILFNANNEVSTGVDDPFDLINVLKQNLGNVDNLDKIVLEKFLEAKNEN